MISSGHKNVHVTAGACLVLLVFQYTLYIPDVTVDVLSPCGIYCMSVHPRETDSSSVALLQVSSFP